MVLKQFLLNFEISGDINNSPSLPLLLWLITVLLVTEQICGKHGSICSLFKQICIAVWDKSETIMPCIKLDLLSLSHSLEAECRTWTFALSLVRPLVLLSIFNSDYKWLSRVRQRSSPAPPEMPRIKPETFLHAKQVLHYRATGSFHCNRTFSLSQFKQCLFFNTCCNKS